MGLNDPSFKLIRRLNIKIELQNKVALITGSSKGIGKAIARAMAQTGCQVILTARNEKELLTTVREIQDEGGKAFSIPADVTKSKDVTDLIQQIISQFGTIDILVNNAGGVHDFVSFESLSDQDWIEMLELNLLSNVRVTRAVLPYMQGQKWGRIVNISSESGTQPDALIPHYNAAKAAITNLTKSLSKAYSKDGILINAVSPAFILTPQIEGILMGKAKERKISVEAFLDDLFQTLRPNIQRQRPGQPEEVASAVVFLASEQASFITGTNLRVDGGSVASI